MCPAARCRPGGRTKSASMSVPRSWRFFAVPRSRLPTSPGPGDPPGVHRSGRLWDSPGVPAFAAHGSGSVCRGFLWDAAPGQPSGGGGHRGVPPEESARLAQEMPAKAITVAQDETFTGRAVPGGDGACEQLILLEQAAQARDHDTWHALMEQALRVSTVTSSNRRAMKRRACWPMLSITLGRITRRTSSMCSMN